MTDQRKADPKRAREIAENLELEALSVRDAESRNELNPAFVLLTPDQAFEMRDQLEALAAEVEKLRLLTQSYSDARSWGEVHVITAGAVEGLQETLRETLQVADEQRTELVRNESAVRQLGNKLTYAESECERWQLRFHCPRHGNKDWDAECRCDLDRENKG